MCVCVCTWGKSIAVYSGQHSKSPYHVHRNCVHAQAKIARPGQLEQYLNDLLPSCFGVQIEGSFTVPFQHGHFSLHCTHFAQTGAQWDDLHVSTGGAVRPDVKHHTMQAHH